MMLKAATTMATAWYRNRRLDYANTQLCKSLDRFHFFHWHCVLPFTFNNKLFRMVPVFRTISYYTVSHGCIVEILILNWMEITHKKSRQKMKRMAYESNLKNCHKEQQKKCVQRRDLFFFSLFLFVLCAAEKMMKKKSFLICSVHPEIIFYLLMTRFNRHWTLQAIHFIHSCPFNGWHHLWMA